MDPRRRCDPAPGAGERAWGPSLFCLAGAVGIVAGALAYWLLPSAPAEAQVAAAVPAVATPEAGAAVIARPATPPDGASHAAPVRVAALRDPGAAVPAHAAPAAQPPREPERDNDPTPDLRDFLNPGEVPTMAEVIRRLNEAGIHGGLGAFSPPGTSPPLVGLAVPEDYVLPEGYVRHYQATDDGQRIEPILMYSPDYAFFDTARRPIAIPEDRVVPAELAPPGLPMRRIAIPAPAPEPRRPGR